MTEQEIQYVAEQHLLGRPMTSVAAELHYNVNTLWTNLKKSGLIYKRRDVRSKSRAAAKTTAYWQGYQAGRRAERRKQNRELKAMEDEEKFIEAIGFLEREYDEARAKGDVNKPMAYAVHQVWKIFDEHESGRLVKGGD